MEILSAEQAQAKNITVGLNVIIGKNVNLGENCIIGNNVTIHDDTTIGNNVRIDDNSVIGKNLMKAANSATTKQMELEGTIIGDECLIGSCCVIYRGTKLGNKILVADQAAVQFKTTIDDFTIIGRSVLIESRCQIGKKVKIESNAYLTAYSTVEDYCFIAPGVITTNDNFVGRTEERFKHFRGVTLKRGARVGANSTILPGKTIYEDALIAAGSVVTKDIPEGKIYAGNPARELRDVPPEQLLKNNL